MNLSQGGRKDIGKTNTGQNAGGQINNHLQALLNLHLVCKIVYTAFKSIVGVCCQQSLEHFLNYIVFALVCHLNSVDGFLGGQIKSESIHFYGLYSSDLDFAVRELCDDGILDIKYTSMEHKISVADNTFANRYDNQTVNEIVDEFGKESPSNLELLATALYVFLQVRDADKVKDDVVRIKGTKYTGRQIDTAITRLRRTGYIAT